MSEINQQIEEPVEKDIHSFEELKSVKNDQKNTNQHQEYQEKKLSENQKTKNMTIKRRLLFTFGIMALITFIVGFFGVGGVGNLADKIRDLVTNFNKLSGIFTLSEGFYAIRTAEATLLNQELEEEDTQIQYAEIKKLWVYMEEGQKRYELTKKSPEEEQLWQDFKKNWNKWQMGHTEFMKLSHHLDQTGYRRRYFEGRTVSESETDLIIELSEQGLVINQMWFTASMEILKQIIELNLQQGTIDARIGTNHARIIIFLCLIIGLAGVIFAIFMGILMSSRISHPIVKVTDTFKYLARGDLTRSFDLNYRSNDEIGKMGDTINYMFENLSNIINQLKRSVSEMSSSSTEIASTNEEITLNANEEIKMTTEATASVTELNASIQQVANNSLMVYETAEKTLENVIKGTDSLGITLDKTKKTKDNVDNSADNLFQLQDQAQEILEILEIINKISEKIDLLALNAAIEAGGSEGASNKRFRVVADEMRKLADNSLRSSKKIENVLTAIHKGVEESVSMMRLNVSSMNEVMDDLEKTGQLMNEVVVQSLTETINLMKEASMATSQQARATETFKEMVTQINVAASETMKGMKNAKIAVENFVDISMNLKKIVDKFKT